MSNEELLERLKWEMIEWERGCPKRIQHFLKVNSFALTIGRGEGVDEHTLFLLSALGYIHDIGIRIAEERDGRYNGKTQEVHGEPAARKLLDELGFAPEDVDRISMIVGKHHTYNASISCMDFRILLEADACVNMYEKEASEAAKRAMLKAVFRTETGKRLYCTMFDLKEQETDIIS